MLLLKHAVGRAPAIAITDTPASCTYSQAISPPGKNYPQTATSFSAVTVNDVNFFSNSAAYALAMRSMAVSIIS